MAEMRAAIGTQDLGPDHADTVIRAHDYLRLADDVEEARPAAVRVELVGRLEEHFAADDAAICAGIVLVPVGAGEGSLGGSLLSHGELNWSEPPAERFDVNVGLHAADPSARIALIISPTRATACGVRYVALRMMKPPKPAATYLPRMSTPSATVAGTTMLRRSSGIWARKAALSRSDSTTTMGTETVRRISAGSRPIASQCRSRTSSLLEASSKVPNQLVMSANCAASLRVRFSPPPPTRIFGPPRWIGRGTLRARSIR